MNNDLEVCQVKKCEMMDLTMPLVRLYIIVREIAKIEPVLIKAYPILNDQLEIVAKAKFRADQLLKDLSTLH